MHELQHQLNRIEQEMMSLRRHLDMRLDRSHERQNAMRQTMEDLAAAIKDYTAKVQVWVDAANVNQKTSDEIVAAAVAAEDAGEDVDMAKMTADLRAAADKVPAPPTAPVVDSSAA